MLATASEAIEAACLSLQSKHAACISVSPQFTAYRVQQQAAKMLNELCLSVVRRMTLAAMACLFMYHVTGQAFYLRNSRYCMDIAVARIAAVIFQWAYDTMPRMPRWAICRLHIC